MTAPQGGPPSAVHRNLAVQELPHALQRPSRVAAFCAPAPAYEDGYRDGRAHAAAEARAAADALLRQRGDDWERARQEAVAAGRAEGLQAAQADVAHAVESERVRLQGEADAGLRARCAQLERLAASVQGQWHELVASAEDEVVALAWEAVCGILATEAARPEAVRMLVSQLMRQHFSACEVRAHVHPEDHELLAASGGAQRDGWTWVADAGVALGGASLRTAQGSLDARIESQLQRLARTLLRVREARREQQAAGEARQP